MIRGASRVWLVWVVLIATVAVNALANILPFNNITTAEVSALYPSEFTPANYVFSIWSLIYVGLLCFAVYQSSKASRKSTSDDLLGVLFIIGNILNSLWLVLWHYQYILWTLPVMIGLLLCLIRMHQIAYAHKSSQFYQWCVRAPISLYLGWISVATIANASVFFLELGWNGWPLTPIVWTILLCVVAVGLAIAQYLRHKDVVYGLVIAWAILGIILK